MSRHAKHINPNPEGTIPSGIDAERLVHSIPLGILVFDLNATLLYANANAEDILGRPWADLAGDRWLQVIHPDDFAEVIQSFTHAVQTQQPWRCTCRIVRSGQDRVRVNIWAIAQANVVEDQIVYLASLQDVPDLQQAQISCETPLSDRQHNVEIIADAVPVGLYRNDADGNCVYINQETCKILDITFEECLGHDWASRLHPEDAERMLYSWQRAFEAKTFWQDEYRFLHRDGTVIWVMARCVFTFNDRGENTGSVGSLTDITRQKEIELELELVNQELERLANLDGLTEVANRRYFDQFLHQEWLRLRRSQHPLSLLMIDIDCFKAYNDTYGHVQGDQILKTVAQLLHRTIRRPADLVARYGGEEFVIVLPDTDAAGANHLADEILTEIHGLAIPHQGSSVKDALTLSIGIGCQVPAMERSPDDLILQADQALYLAKIQGRDRVVTNP